MLGLLLIEWDRILLVLVWVLVVCCVFRVIEVCVCCWLSWLILFLVFWLYWMVGILILKMLICLFMFWCRMLVVCLVSEGSGDMLRFCGFSGLKLVNILLSVIERLCLIRLMCMLLKVLYCWNSFGVVVCLSC